MVYILTVNTLGKFQIVNGKIKLDSDSIHSDMLVKLLVYLMIHREHSVGIQELTDALWQEDETENPAGALKNLVYRLRTILKKVFGEQDYILTSRGAYYWNKDIELTVDAEAFEKYCTAARNASDRSHKIKSYEKGIQIYKGDFMPQLYDRHWAVTLTTYYHSMFLSAVKELAGLYMEEGQFDLMEKLCTNALTYDNVDEQLHCYIVISLIRQNKQKLAMEYYEKAAKILYEELGIRNSVKLKEVYKELLQMNGGEQKEGIENIHRDMIETESPEGAFLCSYQVFKEIYRLEARKISRLKESEYVLLLTVDIKGKSGDKDEQLKRYLVNQAMNQVERILEEALRIGDVAARYSDVQFVVLLPTCTYESCQLVIDRILTKFEQKNKNKNISVQTDLEEVTTTASRLVK